MLSLKKFLKTDYTYSYQSVAMSKREKNSQRMHFEKFVYGGNLYNYLATRKA